MQSSRDYTDDQIKAIGKHFLKQNSRKNINHEIWSDDANLPPGWKWKIPEGKTDKVSCLSPDGSQFQSRKPSSVNMIKNNHNEEAIVEMKKTLTIEDVEENVNLPAGWLYKERSAKNSNGISVIVTIITEKGVIHETFLSIFEMMKSKPAYDENDAQRLKALMDEKSSIRRQKLE